MKTSLSIKTLALGLLLVMSLYGFSCGPILEHCAENDDCATGQQCVSNQCISPTVSTGCRKNSDCKPGGVCGKGGCVYKEICGDKLDNNYNGQVDEGCSQPSITCKKTTDCKTGEVCSQGKCFKAPPCQAEVCGDHIDNDCDGEIDEGCSNTCTSMKDCGKGQVCSKGKCINGPPPCGPEICHDGKDNDCDGIVDEGCSRVCKSNADCANNEFCGKGVCVRRSCGPEVCGDKLDNDCDGLVDENCAPVCKSGQTRNCYTGPRGTIYKGVCKMGLQKCEASGQWGACVGQVGPSPEICNNRRDDDCDGTIDEVLCSQARCKSEADCPRFHLCGKGTCIQKCSTEFCGDGKDNDCDGVVDEKDCQPMPCSNDSDCPPARICGKGSCVASCGKTELCGDKLDNDCDGIVDEKDCQSPKCKQSADCPLGWKCSKDLCFPACMSKEICGDKLDNDCNGKVDDGCKPVCNRGEVRLCYTGDKRDLLQFGTCRKGVQICNNGQWGACKNEIKPSVEVCGDRLDNNCNGLTDENCSTRRCKVNQDCLKDEFCSKGVCAREEKKCLLDKHCSSGEICHRNRCITARCYPKSILTCYNGCKQGFRRCNFKTMTYETCSNLKPALELCDGKDNDCDGKVDEDCADPCQTDSHCAKDSFCFQGSCKKRVP